MHHRSRQDPGRLKGASKATCSERATDGARERMSTEHGEAERAQGYSRLLSLFQRKSRPTQQESQQEASPSGKQPKKKGVKAAISKKSKRAARAAKASTTASSKRVPAGQSQPPDPADAAADDELEGEGEGEGEGGEVLMKEADEDADEEAAEVAEEAKWTSAAYDAHFGPEWSEPELEQQRGSLATASWHLDGVGDADVVAPPSASAPMATGLGGGALLRECGVLPALRAKWKRAHGGVSASQRSVLSTLCRHSDLLHACVPLGGYEEMTPVLALHALQHVIVTRRMLQRHAKKGLAPTDQGFTRPKVLVVLPFRELALRFVQALLALLPEGYEQVENKARFVREFGEEEGAAQVPATKPEDYRALFAGNNDDCFRCGLALTRKAAKLYASFYKADLIVASPLGLRVALGDGGKKRDADWLSSIELAIVPYADVLLMQNWSHTAELFDALNLLPTEQARPRTGALKPRPRSSPPAHASPPIAAAPTTTTTTTPPSGPPLPSAAASLTPSLPWQRDTDFSRVRPWYLDGSARHLRQTVVMAAQPSSELAALMRGCSNVAGLLVTRPTYAGLLERSPPGVRQVFRRFTAEDPASAADVREQAFRDLLLPSIINSLSNGPEGRTMLYVPSYFDFVRVRRLLAAEDVPFAAISEYSTVKQVSRARTDIQQGNVPLLLYSERAHFFRRHKIRGVRHLAVYALPSYAHFWLELLEMLERGDLGGEGGGQGGSTCAVLFSRLDLMQLQRMVGDERAARMLTGDEESFLFC